jgi:hypothetical protein
MYTPAPKIEPEPMDNQYVETDFAPSGAVFNKQFITSVSFPGRDQLKFVLNSLPPGAWVAEGYLTWVRGNFYSEPSDIDVFFTNLSELKNYKLFLTKNGYNSTESPFGCINLVKSGHKTIQLIVKKFNDVNHILDSFDFTICQLALNKNEAVSGQTTLSDIDKKIINIHRWSETPGHTMKRIFKYMDKGFNPNKTTIQTIWIKGCSTVLSNPPKLKSFENAPLKAKPTKSETVLTLEDHIKKVNGRKLK